MRLIFMGTPYFAREALISLSESRHDVMAVFTQPDKPKGRSKKLVPSEVKEEALLRGIDVYQPNRLRDLNEFELIKDMNPDVIVVAAYGQILPKEILELPKYGCINIHASLLPKYRGAAPINRCIIDREAKTGITIMQMDIGLDTGDILLQEEVDIAVKETSTTLTNKMAKRGADMIVKTLDLLENNAITPIKQDDEASNYAKMIKKDMGNVSFDMKVEDAEALVRGIDVWPNVIIKLNGKRIKVYSADFELEGLKGSLGEITRLEKDSIYVQFSNGNLILREIQPEGKKRMKVSDFLRGNKVLVGDKFEQNI